TDRRRLSESRRSHQHVMSQPPACNRPVAEGPRNQRTRRSGQEIARQVLDRSRQSTPDRHQRATFVLHHIAQNAESRNDFRGPNQSRPAIGLWGKRCPHCERLEEPEAYRAMTAPRAWFPGVFHTVEGADPAFPRPLLT